MCEVFNKLNEELSAKNIDSFRIIGFSGNDTLIIAGSLDFGYYHDIEIYFHETTYISCPTSFNYAKFRFATSEERKELLPKLFDGFEDLVICIVLDEECGKNPVNHFIVAKNVEYRAGTVFYYKRDGLKEGEGIAEWVK